MKIAHVLLVAMALIVSACSSGRGPTDGGAVTPTAQAAAVTPVPPTVEPTAGPVVTPTVAATPAHTATPTAEPTVPPSPTAALPTATPIAPEPIAVAGECQNPYSPVVAGASWQYRFSGPDPETESTFVRSITAVRANGFDEQDVFGDLTRQSSWECRQGNLINLTSASSLSVAVAGMPTTQMTVEANTGITFPADPRPGMAWTQNVVLRSRIDQGGMDLESRNAMDISCQAIGMETVSVPAGNFEALRVDCTSKMEVSVSGIQAFPLTETSSAWYARGVGWIKSSGSTSTGTTEIVLLAYTIP